jgi:hypothetical protein
MRTLATTLILGCFGLGCSFSSRPTRPATALELCAQLVKKSAVEGLECVKVTDAEMLTMLQAVEAAALHKRGVSGKDGDLGWVSFLAAPPDPTSMSGMMQLMGRQFAGLALLEVHNDGARVGAYFRRGEIGANAWDDVSETVTALAAR